jgi:uncharacterized membrane protein
MMLRSIRRMGALVACVVSSFAYAIPPAAGRPASFTPVGFLGGAAKESRANAASFDGSVVVGRVIRNNNFYAAFRWTPSGGMVVLDDLAGGAEAGQAYGVSSDGTTLLGEAFSTNNGEAVVWSGPAYAVQPLKPPAGSMINSFAEDITPDKSVITGSRVQGGSFKAFRWTQGTGVVNVGPGGGFSTATGVSTNGSVVVGYADGGSIHQAFRWTAATGPVTLADLPGGLTHAQARATSGDGAIAVGFSTSGRATNGEAVMWDATGVHPLSANPGPFTSVANGISQDGSIIVGRQSFTSSLDEAFVWDADNGLQNLRLLLASRGVNLAGWRLDEATGISPDGSTVVGFGTNPSGQTEGWVAVLPEPGSMLVAVTCAGMLALQRRRPM